MRRRVGEMMYAPTARAIVAAVRQVPVVSVVVLMEAVNSPLVSSGAVVSVVTQSHSHSSDRPGQSVTYCVLTK